MNTLAPLIQEVIVNDLLPHLKTFRDADADAEIDAFIHSTLAAVEAGTKDSVVEQSDAYLVFARTRDDEFAHIIGKKWGHALDRMEVFWALCEECGRMAQTERRDGNSDEPNYRADALARIHARALLVTREIICLLRNGYPDGALARWRSLHEHAVQAMFITRRDQQTAMRFLASADFRARDGARQYNRYSDRANLKPFSNSEIEALDRRCQGLEPYTGPLGRNGDYDWAAEALGNKRPKLTDLEAATSLDHWRPRYRWASQHAHAPHRHAGALLGVAGIKREALLIGASDRGLTDPLQMSGISLLNCTTAFLLQVETLDSIVWSRVLEHLIDQLIQAAIAIEPSVPDEPDSDDGAASAPDETHVHDQSFGAGSSEGASNG